MDKIPQTVNVIETLQQELLVRYFLAVGSALFIYDVLIHLDIEVRCIWTPLNPRKRSIKRAALFFNLLYLVQRYSPLLDTVVFDLYLELGASGSRACTIAYISTASLSVLGVLLSELMLALRIWAVWGLKPSIMAVLVATQVACLAPTPAFYVRFVEGWQFPEVYIPGAPQIQRCFYFTQNRDVYMCWVMLMIYDSVSFALMAIPGFQAYRTGGASNFVKVIYRDGVIYYVLIFAVSLLNVIMILVLPSNLAVMITPFERVLHSIFASHAVLHIRQQVSLSDTQMRDFTGGTVTTTRGELTTINTEIGFEPGTLRSVGEGEA